MVVKCNKICWDSTRGIKYFPGDQDDIDPLSPIATYFDFPEGTEVYHKIKGKAHDKDGKGGTPNIETTRIVGFPQIVLDKDQKEETETCPICNSYKGRRSQVTMHKVHCAKKQVDKTEE